MFLGLKEFRYGEFRVWRRRNAVWRVYGGDEECKVDAVAVTNKEDDDMSNHIWTRQSRLSEEDNM